MLVVIFAPEVAPFCIHPPLTLLKALAHCALMKIVWQERQGMLSRSYWRPRKKNYWSLRFEPWTKLGSKSALLRKPYFLDHSQIPTRECVFFFAPPNKVPIKTTLYRGFVGLASHPSVPPCTNNIQSSRRSKELRSSCPIHLHQTSSSSIVVLPHLSRVNKNNVTVLCNIQRWN